MHDRWQQCLRAVGGCGASAGERLQGAVMDRARSHGTIHHVTEAVACGSWVASCCRLLGSPAACAACKVQLDRSIVLLGAPGCLQAAPMRAAAAPSGAPPVARRWSASGPAAAPPARFHAPAQADGGAQRAAGWRQRRQSQSGGGGAACGRRAAALRPAAAKAAETEAAEWDWEAQQEELGPAFKATLAMLDWGRLCSQVRAWPWGRAGPAQ